MVPLSLDARLTLMVQYLLLKVQERDWHGVADAAMDLRELEVEKRYTGTAPPTPR